MIRWRWVWFSFSMLLVILAWPASQRLSLDRSLQKMFAASDPVRVDFELLQEYFGVSDLVVFAYRDSRLWDEDGSGFANLLKIRNKIEAIDGVRAAVDLSKMDQMLSRMDAATALLSSLTGKSQRHPLLDPQNTMAMKFKSLLEGQTHSQDSDLVAIACLLESDTSTNSTQSQTLKQLRTLANSLPEDGVANSPGMLVGQPVMVEEGFEEIEKDGVRLAYFSTVGLSLLIIVGFRSLRWALITIGVVQWSLIVTRGLLVWLAWDLTMVSSMLSSIVTVIGVATTMHWMLGYRQALSEGMSPEAAIRTSMQSLWKPIMWACITDAIGFASLVFAKVGPVQDYGSMMALASLVVLAGIFALVPTLALIPLFTSKFANLLGIGFELHRVPGDAPVRRVLVRIKSMALGFPKTILLSALALGCFALIGSLRLQVETDFIKNFRKDAPLVLAYQAFENELGGAGVWDVLVPSPQVLDQAYFDEVMKLEQSLMAIEIAGEKPLRLTKVMSIVDADAAARASSVLGKATIEMRWLGMRQWMEEFANTMISKAPNRSRFVRIMLRSREQSETIQKEQLIARVRQTVHDATHSDRWRNLVSNGSDFVVSGYYVLLSNLVSSIVADQWRCFAIATVGVWLATTIALRNPWLAVLSILPNALPSLCILGWMGWTGMRVNLGAAMIAAVSMGLSVDSSLHYLLRYQRERNEGNSFEKSVGAAQSEIGMAMLLSTIALVIGFGSLSFSDFLPTVVFGTTAAISMLGGLLGNLILLPSLLMIARRTTR